jgi:hypothetical protein
MVKEKFFASFAITECLRIYSIDKIFVVAFGEGKEIELKCA